MDIVTAEHSFEAVANWIALAMDCIAILIIAFAALQALVGIFRPDRDQRDFFLGRKKTWMKFAFWLMLALEFALASDIVRSAIAPTWTDLGQLAAIALIRTFLNYFLQRDVKEYAGPAFGLPDRQETQPPNNEA